MSSEFCDWVPCSQLQRFVDQLAPKDRPSRSLQVLAYVPKSNPRVEPLRRVTFYYCPFCGTRIEGNKEVLDWIDTRIGEADGREISTWRFSPPVRSSAKAVPKVRRGRHGRAERRA
jgi:hypothetical protein